MTRIAMTGASGRYGRLATDKLIAQGRARDLILITRTPAKLETGRTARSVRELIEANADYFRSVNSRRHL